MDIEQSNEPRMSGRGDGGALVRVERKRCFPPTLHDVVIGADGGRYGSPQPYERTGHPHWSWSGACPPP